MPRTFETDGLPGGYAMAPALDGENAIVETTGFYSSEDGNEFITRLEGISSYFRAGLTAFGIKVSQVDNFLAVVDRNRQATIYCNELALKVLVRMRKTRPIAPGDMMTANDIADIQRVELFDRQGAPVTVPPDCGVVIIISHGWRKGIYFDFSVLKSEAAPRRDDLPRLFGQFMSRLAFQEMYTVTESQWSRLLDWGWFPFIGLTHTNRVDLLRLANFDRDPRPFLEPMCRDFAQEVSDRLAVWTRNELLAQHDTFLTRARDHYLQEDYLSCLCVLIPRIEGVLRSLFVEENPQEQVNQEMMVSNLVENQHAHSLLLPDRFEEYLRRVYFRAFNQNAGDLPLSRHSHGHGVSIAGDYDFIWATVAFLTVDQISYYLQD